MRLKTVLTCKIIRALNTELSFLTSPEAPLLKGEGLKKTTSKKGI